MKPRLAASGTLISPVDQANPYSLSQVKHSGILKPQTAITITNEEEEDEDNQYLTLDPLVETRRGSIKSLRPTVLSPPPKPEGRAWWDLTHKTIYAIIIFLTMCSIIALAFVAVSIFVAKHDSSARHSHSDSNSTHTIAQVHT